MRSLRLLFKRTNPNTINKVVAAASSLAMERDECVYLAPVPGMYGPVRMSGATLPYFNFLAYDKARKEFIRTTVSVAMLSLPFRFSSKTEDEGFEVPTCAAHKKLAMDLFKSIANHFQILPPHKTKDTTYETPKATESVQAQNDSAPVPREVLWQDSQSHVG